jgi:hypothetical protein
MCGRSGHGLAPRALRAIVRMLGWAALTVAAASPAAGYTHEGVGTPTPVSMPVSTPATPGAATDSAPVPTGLDALPQTIGPFAVTDATGQNSLRFRFAAQVLATYTNNEAPTAGADRVDGGAISIRRLRPILAGSFVSERLTYLFQLNVAPGDLRLMDLYIDYAPLDAFRFRVGQMKVPFTRYRQMSFARLEFIDWALTSRVFGAERQTGVTFHNGIETNPEGFEYQLGVFTGQSAQRAFATGNATQYRDALPDTGSLTAPAAIVRPAPEIVAHIAWNGGGIRLQRWGDEVGGGFRYTLGLSGAFHANPALAGLDPLVAAGVKTVTAGAVDAYRGRLAPEFAMKIAGWSFAAIGYAAWSELTQSGGTALAALGMHLETAYRFNRWVDLAFRWAAVSYTRALRDDARARATLIAQAATGALPSGAEALIKTYSPAGTLEQDMEYTLAVNFYIIGDALRWQADASWLPQTVNGATLDNVRARTQLTLFF